MRMPSIRRPARKACGETVEIDVKAIRVARKERIGKRKLAMEVVVRQEKRRKVNGRAAYGLGHGYGMKLEYGEM